MEEQQWARTASDDQFWSLQYIEHLTMIIEILSCAGLTDFVNEAISLRSNWEKIHQHVLNPNNKITSKQLETLHNFKLQLVTSLMTLAQEKQWPGYAPITMYDHMIREVEYLEKPKTERRVIAQWLTDMHGHAALDASWIDPNHGQLVKKAQEFCKLYEQFKLFIGQNSELGLNELLSRFDELNGNPIEWINYEVPENADTTILATELLPLQVALTNFHIEIRNLMNQGLIFTNMTELFINHTIRESLRAVYELEMLSKGTLIP
jgi:hypothetical protein